MAERERFAHRRGAELVDFEHEGRKWTATVGRFADGRISEIFIDGPKEARSSSWHRRARSSRAWRFKAGVPSKRCATLSPKGAMVRWAPRWHWSPELGHENRTGNRIGGTRQCRRADEDLQVSNPAYQAM
jgi:hypothetical protein